MIHSKRLAHLLMLALAFAGLMMLGNCKNDDPLPETERIGNLLKSGAWQMLNVTVDGVDQTSLYAGLTLTFTTTSYTTTEGGTVWPASGTWTFADETGTKVTRSDGLEITVIEISENSMKLSFTWAKTTLGTGRTSGLSGKHVFSFKH